MIRLLRENSKSVPRKLLSKDDIREAVPYTRKHPQRVYDILQLAKRYIEINEGCKVRCNNNKGWWLSDDPNDLVAEGARSAKRIEAHQTLAVQVLRMPDVEISKLSGVEQNQFLGLQALSSLGPIGDIFARAAREAAEEARRQAEEAARRATEQAEAKAAAEQKAYTENLMEKIMNWGRGDAPPIPRLALNRAPTTAKKRST